MVDSFKKNGFTLIEILVSVVISLLVFGLIVVGYLDFSSSREIRQKAYELKSQLRLVRSKAINGEKPNASCVNLNSYRVYTVVGENNSLFYCPVCSDVCTGEKEINLGIDYTISSTDSEFFFTAVDGSMVGNEVEIVVAKDTLSCRLTVLASGEIQVDEL
jgi:prepilin-type N-terminal cleavage/methylation domain-containing protein